MQVIPLKTQQSRMRVAKFRRKLILAAILLNVLAYVIVTWSLSLSRQDYQKRAETSAQTIAKQLKQNIANTLEVLDSNMLATKDEIDRQQASGGINDAALHSFLKQLHSALPEMSSIRVVYANGVIAHDSGHGVLTPARVNDREYFQFLQDHPQAGLYISKPLRERTSGDWILVLSRRFDHPDGSFAGVLNSTVSLNHFQHLFSSPEIGPSGMVSLRNDELGIIARNPTLPETELGVASNKILPEWQAFLRSARQNWLSITKSPVDGVTRTMAAHKVANFPLYVIVGLAPDDYLTQWWQAFAIAGESLLLFTMMTALVSLLLYHHWLDRILFAVSICSIRSRPCRRTGRRNGTSLSALSRLQSTWRSCTETFPETYHARRAGK